MTARDDGEFLFVQVRDTGIGIALDDQRHIFDKFYRVQSEATERINGSGLGLSIVKAIVEKHNGRVWVESEPGQRQHVYGGAAQIPAECRLMSERLYYADSYLRTFEAQVIERLDINGHAAVVLDRSAFYPEGGGQPSDRGTLNQAHVIDVIERESDGAVLHVLAEPLAADRVVGTIDERASL